MRGLNAGVLIALSLTAFAAGGCGTKDLSTPPKISYGRDTCAQCRMIIQDERFACAAVSAERRYLKFDDVGCLVKHEIGQAAADPRSWVRVGAGWLEKDKAFFVRSPDLVTPMGYGIVAFASAEEAENSVKDKGGRGVVWDELKTEEVK